MYPIHHKVQTQDHLLLQASCCLFLAKKIPSFLAHSLKIHTNPASPPPPLITNITFFLRSSHTGQVWAAPCNSDCSGVPRSDETVSAEHLASLPAYILREFSFVRFVREHVMYKSATQIKCILIED